MIPGTHRKMRVEDKGCSPRVPVPPGTNTFCTLIPSYPQNHLPLFLRQTFLPWSPVSQWVLHWTFFLSAPYFPFLWKSGKFWTCLAQRTRQWEWAVSVCALFPRQQRLKMRKKAAPRSCWDVWELRNSLSTFSPREDGVRILSVTRVILMSCQIQSPVRQGQLSSCQAPPGPGELWHLSHDQEDTSTEPPTHVLTSARDLPWRGFTPSLALPRRLRSSELPSWPQRQHKREPLTPHWTFRADRPLSNLLMLHLLRELPTPHALRRALSNCNHFHSTRIAPGGAGESYTSCTFILLVLPPFSLIISLSRLSRFTFKCKTGLSTK